MSRFTQVLLVFLLCGSVVFKLSAQNMAGKTDSSPSSSLVKLVSDDLKETFDKVIQLANAMPAEDYSWRPEEGVRSVGEVYVHIAMSNYFFLSYLGLPMPKEIKPGTENQNLEKAMTGKDEIISLLKKSYADAADFLSNYTGTDFDTVVDLPFGKFTKAQILMLTATHPHEHLGQSIAYARTNHIVPPWSK
jgi:uncharacterized damage-inducible protein DinB